jgi:hypothetical protein
MRGNFIFSVSEVAANNPNRLILFRTWCQAKHPVYPAEILCGKTILSKRQAIDIAAGP